MGMEGEVGKRKAFGLLFVDERKSTRLVSNYIQ